MRVSKEPEDGGGDSELRRLERARTTAAGHGGGEGYGMGGGGAAWRKGGRGGRRGSGIPGTGDLARRSQILSPGSVGLQGGPCPSRVGPVPCCRGAGEDIKRLACDSTRRRGKRVRGKYGFSGPVLISAEVGRGRQSFAEVGRGRQSFLPTSAPASASRMLIRDVWRGSGEGQTIFLGVAHSGLLRGVLIAPC